MDIKNLYLHVGLEIVIRKDSPEKEIRFVGKVIGWDQGNYLLIKIPEQMNIHQLHLMTPLVIGYMYDGTVYGFNNKLLQSMKYKETDIILVSYPNQHETINLRKVKRIKVNIKGTYRLSPDEEPDKASISCDCQIVDLSLNGCAITTLNVLKTGKKILLSFSLPLKGDLIDLPGTTVNISKPLSDEFKYGIKFLENEQLQLISSFKPIIDMMDQT
jgi:hypothetical protein